MTKERTNIYITERQKNQLEKRSQAEHLPMAEIIRRALDAYLAWDDPTYIPMPQPQERKTHSSTPFKAWMNGSSVCKKVQFLDGKVKKWHTLK